MKHPAERTSTRVIVKDRVTAVLAGHFGSGFHVSAVTRGAAALVTAGRDTARLVQYAAALREAGLVVSDRSDRGSLYVREDGPEHDVEMAREVAGILARGYGEHIRLHGPDGAPPPGLSRIEGGGAFTVKREGGLYDVIVTPR